MTSCCPHGVRVSPTTIGFAAKPLQRIITNMRTHHFVSLLLFLLALNPGPTQAQAPTAPPARAYRVLLVGNDMTYTNNLPALLRAVGTAQGTPIITETFAAPGGTLSDRLDDGHASAALGQNHYDAIVLQEQGGKLAACMAKAQRNAPCTASLRAYRAFANQARTQNAKVLVFSSWGPDRRWNARLGYSARNVAEQVGGSIFNAAGALDSFRKAQPGSNPLPDGQHPNIQASLLLALTLYRDITGNVPTARDLQITAPLLPFNAAVAADRPIEAQPGLAGDGKVTVVPAALIAPLLQALPKARPDGASGDEEEDEEE